jgi:hypothetical protein
LPRGQNLKAGPERDAATAKIRSQRHRYAIGPVPPKPEPEQVEQPSENPDEHPTPGERQRASWAMRAARALHWQVPTVNSDGRLCARPLPEDMVLPFESLDEVAKEIPSYLAFSVEQSELGIMISGPGILPQLVSEDEIVPALDESVPSNGAEPEPVEIVEIDGVVMVGGDDPAAA